MPDPQIRHETVVVRQGLLASDPQHVWQLAAQKAQGLVGAADQVVNVQLGTAHPAVDEDNSTDMEVPFTFQLLPAARS